MRFRRPVLPPQVASAARVALIATLLMAAVYGGCIAVLDKLVADRLLAQVDTRLSERLADVGPADATRLSAVDADDDDDDDAGAPVMLWALTGAPGTRAPGSRGAGGPGSASTGPGTGPATAPALPGGLPLASGRPVSARIGPAMFRLLARRRGGTLVVAGQSLAEQDHIEADLFGGEALAAPVLLLAMFAGSLLIGLKALSPVEQSRRRQLEFTADASHELRTPLSVISAETGIALASTHKAAEYRDTLHRIQGEARRLRGIVDDLLWLARFDSRPPPPGSEPLDLATIAQECADRFGPVARSGDLRVWFAAAARRRRHWRRGDGRRAGLDQRPAGVDRPAGRGADGQRLPVRRSRRQRADRRRAPRRPGQPGGRGQRSRHSGGAAGPAVRPVPPRERAAGRGRRAGDRRLDRALDRRPLADRRLATRRRAVRGLLAPVRPALAAPCHADRPRLGLLAAAAMAAAASRYRPSRRDRSEASRPDGSIRARSLRKSSSRGYIPASAAGLTRESLAR